MQHSYWHKQAPDAPLFPALEWSRPENKRHAGKLLVIGGNLHGFAAPAQSFQETGEAGAGSVHALLPDKIQKVVGGFLPEATFASSTPSGSFSRASLDEWLLQSEWADAVLIAGDLGRNSETAIVLESYTQKYAGRLTLTQDAIDYFAVNPSHILDRQHTLLVTTFTQLQKLAMHTQSTISFTSEMGLLHFVEALHNFSRLHAAILVVKHQNTICVAFGGEVSTTSVSIADQEPWQIRAASRSAVWWMQHHAQPFEAITTAIIV